MGQQRREDPTSAGQRGVVALFDYLSVLHHPDGVPVCQPLELVGDQQRGLLGGGVGQGLHDPLFAMGVEAGGGLIQQQQAAGHQ